MQLSNTERAHLRSEIAAEVESRFGKDGLTDRDAVEVRALAWRLRRKLEREKRQRIDDERRDFRGSLEAALKSARQETESPIEEQLVLALHTQSICAGEFRTRYVVGPYRLDIAFPKVKLDVECDGRDYHSSPADIGKDQRRDQYLSMLGWTVLRLTGSEIHKQMATCVERVVWMYGELCKKHGVKEAWE